MDVDKLLKKTGSYLEDYLDVYPEQQSDVRHFLCDREIHPSQVRQFSSEDIDTIDLHKTRFDSFYSCLPSANLGNFIDVVSDMDSPVVVEVGSHLGERFGLFVANENPSAEVIVMNKDYTRMGKDVLDYKRSPFSFDLKISPDSDVPMKDFHEAVYRANGFENVRFEKANVTGALLNSIADKYNGRNVVIFSERTPSMPVGMTEVISGVVANNDNMDMVLMPLVNTDVKDYNNDPIMQLINRKYKDFIRNEPGTRYEGPETARTRLFSTMNQYLALKGAIDSGANVYRRDRVQEGFFFCRPTHYVSTLKPSKR